MTIEPGFVRTATGSALISMGETRVICTASVQESVPRWMAGAGRGWVTAEYGMLPASTGERKQRDVSRGRPDGRTVEIQRLIGRSLRGVVDFAALGERTIYIDCDVLQADGGTRCASITGGMVALRLACERLVAEERLERGAARRLGGRGLVRDRRRRPPLLDLDYPEDSTAEVDANVVMTADGGLVEVQATAERTPLSRATPRRRCSRWPPAGSSGCAAPRTRRSPPPGERACDPDGWCSPRATPTRWWRCGGSSRRSGSRSTALPDEVELPPEDGETFAENALGKARAAAAATGRAGDRRRLRDRGRGARRRPGVRSARYAGEQATDEENLARLIAEAPRGQRAALRLRAGLRRSPAATSRCSTAPARGGWRRQRRGKRGFGYDPVFVPDEDRR